MIRAHQIPIPWGAAGMFRAVAAALWVLAGVLLPVLLVRAGPRSAVRVASTPALPQATTVFTVTVGFDAVDWQPGDGVCETAPGNGQCTIRAAVLEANARPDDGPYLVLLPAGDYPLTIPEFSEDEGFKGDVDIRASLELRGAGQDVTVIHGPNEDHDHAFEVFAPAVVRVRSLTISDSPGGGLNNRGGQLDVADTTLRANHAYFGGGIGNDGVLTMTDSTIVGNVGAQGGGLVNFGNSRATLRHVRIEGNGDAQGGGMKNMGTLDLADSLVLGNLGGHGGGIELLGDNPVRIRNTTIAHNHAGSHPEPEWHGYGGGIWNQATNVTLVNVTLSDNWGQGGGIYNLGRITVTNSTIAFNGTYSWGAAINNLGDFWLANTLIGPSPQNASCDISRQLLTSGGHNIDMDGSCNLMAPSDRRAIDPLLGPLADNGGPTLTHALRPGSPAIDTADDDVCPDTDQRSVARPIGAGCDIGAYEAEAQPTATTPPPQWRVLLPLVIRGATDALGIRRPASTWGG